MFEFGIMGRENFGHLLNEKDLRGLAVEVGTHRGEFAAQLLEHWGGKLYCVDSWEAGYDPDDPASQGDREADYEACRELLAHRAVLIRQTSARATSRFENGALDFVYVDACHQYESVCQDLRLWWPKLKPGGLLAGHDFICPGEAGGGWGRMVQPAVIEFAEQEGTSIHLVPEDGPWSYYLEKP